METGIAIQRTPSLIAIEINSIKEQTRNMVLYSSIEIGRRLVEVKSMLEHGEWSAWLKDSVEYSQRTATNLMRIFDEYGANQISFFGDNAKRQAFANLSYSQAVALLGVPEDARAKFIKDNDTENMSVRELQQAIKERDQAQKEKEELDLKLKTAEKEVQEQSIHYDNVSKAYKRIEETNKNHYKKAEQLRKELEETKKQLSEAQASGNDEEAGRLSESLAKTDNELANAYVKIEELERQLKEKPIETTATIEKIPDEVQKELDELRKKAGQPGNDAAIKFKLYFDELVSGFKALLGVLAEIPDEDSDRYKKAVSELISKMSERLT